jgi:C1A family cysteine protease
MRSSPAQLATFSVLLILSAVCVAAEADETLLRQSFDDFKQRFGRTYSSGEEDERRFGYFRQNVKKAALLQRNDAHARFGVTKFSDVDPNLKRGRVGHGEEARKAAGEAPPLPLPRGRGIPTVVDWRLKGAVTPPSDMGQCGDPCSFAVTGVIESMYFIAGHRPLTPLSNQQLTSCVGANYGCNGCEPNADYEWIIKDNQGNVATEASYPYNSSDGSVPPCKTKGLVTGATITAWSKVAKNENEMALWLAVHGPLAVIIDATSWQTYTGGVLSGASCSSQGPNHMALLVGYNDSNPKMPYWIIRNEWGADWGENGYIYIQKGNNCCDIITDSPSTVTPKK